jgi:hypothetical protein
MKRFRSQILAILILVVLLLALAAVRHYLRPGW